MALRNIQKFDWRNLFPCTPSSKPSLKFKTVNAIFWTTLVVWLEKYFFRNKTFCFSRQRAETFSVCLKLNFMKPHKNSTHSAYSDNQWLSWNFVRFFQTNSESFSFLYWKTKKFYSKNKLKPLSISIKFIKTKKLCLTTQFSVKFLKRSFDFSVIWAGCRLSESKTVVSK